MSPYPLDTKPLFHSGVALLRKRGFPFFDDRSVAMAGCAAPSYARPSPSIQQHSRGPSRSPAADIVEPGRPGNDEFDLLVPVMSKHPYLLVGSITYYLPSIFFT